MTLPTIPDNTYKLLLYIGIIIIGFSFYKTFEKGENLFKEIDTSNSNIDSLRIIEIRQEKKKEKLLNISSELSKIYKIENPIKVTDSATYFNLTLKGDENEVYVTDSLRKIWDDYMDSKFELDLLDKKIEIRNDNVDTEKEQFLMICTLYTVLVIFGFILCGIGYLGMLKHQLMQEKLIELDISSKEIKYKFCQSCGKNFSSIRKHGKEENGEQNKAFCIECYDLGNFTNPNLTKEEFDLQSKNIISNCKNTLKRKILKVRFNSLERWRDSEYF